MYELTQAENDLLIFVYDKGGIVLPPNMQVKFKPFFCILMAISNPVYGSAIRCYNVR